MKYFSLPFLLLLILGSKPSPAEALPFCARLTEIHQKMKSSVAGNSAIKILTKTEIEAATKQLLRKESDESRLPFKIRIVSTVSSIFLTYLSWKMIGIPIPSYLPDIVFRNSTWNLRYGLVKKFYQWALVGTTAVFLTSHPYVVTYLVDSMLTSQQDLVEIRDKNFNLETSKKRLWESWRQSFYDSEGRWPDPNLHPEDAEEWNREMKHIDALTAEQIKSKFGRK